MKQIPAINRQGDPSHPPGILTRQHDSHSRHIFNLAHPAKGMFSRDLLEQSGLTAQVLRHGRLQKTRAERVAVDTLSGVVQRDLLGQHDCGAFAGTVGGRAIVGHQALHGSDVDDPAAGWWCRAVITIIDSEGRGKSILLQHLLDGVFAAEEDAFGIDGHGSVVIRFGRFVDPHGSQVGALDRDAGVVHHDVQPAEVPGAVLDGRLEVSRAGHVCLDENGVHAIGSLHVFVRGLLVRAAVMKGVGFTGLDVDRVSWARI
jgi:hypothetical protein